MLTPNKDRKLVTYSKFGLVWIMVLQLYLESVLLVEDTGVPAENHRSAASH